MPPPLADFFKTLPGDRLWPWNLLFAATYCATSQKVPLKNCNKWGGGRQFSGTDPQRIANFQTSILAKKLQNLSVLEISVVVQCYLMYSTVITQHTTPGRKLWYNFILLQFSWFRQILLLFLTTKRKMLMWAKLMSNFRLIFEFWESTCLRLLAHQIWLLYLLPVKS